MRCRTRTRTYAQVRGFTLVELLVAMALLSLVMLGMASALRSMGQLEERVDARLEQADEFRIATGFLGQVLGRVSSRKLSRPVLESESAYLFVGHSEQVQWVGVMPARHGMGGLTFFRLAVEDGALVLRFVPFEGSGAFPDWAKSDSRVLVRQVQSLGLAYEDARRAQPVWLPHWSSKEGLPERLRIDLHTAAGAWPLWIVPLRSLPASQGSKGRFSMGPAD